MHIVILGCGFTGARVAERFLDQGAHVIAATRNPASLETLRSRGAEIYSLDAANPRLDFVPDGSLVLHSIPSLRGAEGPFDPTRQLVEELAREAGRKPARVVYLSTTGVYGDAQEVDERTQPAPRSAREQLRLDAERSIAAGPWTSLVLRPAAIYGPGRGIQVSMLRNEYRLAGEGYNFVSRIHVDDLASHVHAALLSSVTGAFPVADKHPCTSREITGFCAGLLGLPFPESAPVEDVPDTRRANRRVDGSAIRNILGITLAYPSYREGIPASI